MNNLTAVSQQISGLVDDNRTQLKPALDKLNGVLEILDNRKKELQRTLYLLRRYAMSFGEVLGAGPFFKASLVNLAPGQFSQPFIDAAFSDLGLDPNVLLPSELVDPGVGQPGTPGAAGALPAHRAGRRSSSDSAGCDHRQPRRSGCGPPGLPLPGPPAATRTASRFPRRRPAGRRPGRPRWAPHPANCRRRPSRRRIPPLPKAVRRRILRTPKGAAVNKRILRIATAASLVVILAVAITVVATPWWKKVNKAASTPRTSPTPTGSTPATRFASSASPSERSRRSTRSRTARRSPSRSTGSTRCLPTPRRRSCRRHWSPLGPSSSSRRTPAVRNSLRAPRFRRIAPRCRSSGTTSVSSWRSSPTPCSRRRPADRVRLASSSTPPRTTCGATVTPRATR